MPIKKQTVKQTKKTRVARTRTVSPNNPKMVSFGRAIANFFKKYFQFSGTATRAEFWWMLLFLAICVFVLIVAGSIVAAAVVHPVEMDPESAMRAKFFVLLPIGVFYIFTIVPWYAVMARRLHDAGFSAKLLWISVMFSVLSFAIPVGRHTAVVNWLSWMWMIILYILFLFPSKFTGNPYRE